MVCSRITLQDCAVCSLVEEIPRQKGNLARALQWGNLTKMQFYALDLKGISFHSGLAKLCLSGTVPGMALSCSENSFGVIHLFPPWILALSASLNLLPQRESWITQAAPANVAEAWAKDAEKVKFVCHGAVRTLAKVQRGSKARLGKRSVWAARARVVCVVNLFTAVCRALEMPSWKEREMFCRGWCCKEQVCEVSGACFPAGRTEEGWGLSVHARCGWAPLAE